MKSEPVLPQRSEIFAARAWLAVCLLLMLALAWLLPRSHINSSVLALLPQQNLGQGAGRDSAGVYAAARPPAGVAGECARCGR